MMKVKIQMKISLVEYVEDRRHLVNNEIFFELLKFNCYGIIKICIERGIRCYEKCGYDSESND